MSGSLHHGYRIRTDSVAELYRIIEDFRGKAQGLATDLLARRLAEKTVEMIDDATVSGKALPRCPLAEVNREVMGDYRESKTTGRRAVYDDFECEANLVPHGDAVYVLLHAEMEEYHDLFLSMPGVEEYRSALHCSEPQWGIPKDEWDRRASVWGEILKGHRLGPLGFHFELLGNYLPHVEPKDVMPHVPTLEARLVRLAQNAAWSDYFKEHREQEFEWDESMRLYSRFERWRKTKEGSETIAKHAERIRGIIRHDLDVVAIWGFDPVKDRRRAEARLAGRDPDSAEGTEPPGTPGPG